MLFLAGIGRCPNIYVEIASLVEFEGLGCMTGLIMETMYNYFGIAGGRQFTFL